MESTETIRCRGHPAVLGAHRTTFEVTKEAVLTPAGDCIIGIGADRAAADLSPTFRRVLADERAVLTTELSLGDCSLIVMSRGSSAMTLDHPTDLVWRRSGYVCPRTVGIYSDHVAAAIPREMIAALRRGEALIVRMTAVIPD